MCDVFEYFIDKMFKFVNKYAKCTELYTTVDNYTYDYVNNTEPVQPTSIINDPIFEAFEEPLIHKIDIKQPHMGKSYIED